MRIMLEYAVDANLDSMDDRDFALWDDWSREVVEVVWACSTSEGFFCQDSLGRRIEVLEKDQERLGRPILRDLIKELYETGSTDIRDYAVRVYYDEES